MYGITRPRRDCVDILASSKMLENYEEFLPRTLNFQSRNLTPYHWATRPEANYSTNFAFWLSIVFEKTAL